VIVESHSRLLGEGPYEGQGNAMEQGKDDGKRDFVRLFRPEAVEHARSQWLGEFRLGQPVGAEVVPISGGTPRSSVAV
jgi:hypothetical protein